MRLRSLKVGDTLPPLAKPPIDRTTLALFAGASNDHNPVHIDIDFARNAGMDDVFAHGMLVMAYLGQLLTNFAPQDALRRFAVRFGAITHLGDEITCEGEVEELLAYHGEPCVRLGIRARNQLGEIKLSGEAVFALPAAA